MEIDEGSDVIVIEDESHDQASVQPMVIEGEQEEIKDTSQELPRRVSAIENETERVTLSDDMETDNQQSRKKKSSDKVNIVCVQNPMFSGEYIITNWTAVDPTGFKYEKTHAIKQFGKLRRLRNLIDEKKALSEWAKDFSYKLLTKTGAEIYVTNKIENNEVINLVFIPPFVTVYVTNEPTRIGDLKIPLKDGDPLSVIYDRIEKAMKESFPDFPVDNIRRAIFAGQGSGLVKVDLQDIIYKTRPNQKLLYPAYRRLLPEFVMIVNTKTPCLIINIYSRSHFQKLVRQTEEKSQETFVLSKAIALTDALTMGDLYDIIETFLTGIDFNGKPCHDNSKSMWEHVYYWEMMIKSENSGAKGMIEKKVYISKSLSNTNVKQYLSGFEPWETTTEQGRSFIFEKKAPVIRWQKAITVYIDIDEVPFKERAPLETRLVLFGKT